jgi:hypothetical protein
VKGVLFNIVEDVVTRALGADEWDDIVDAAAVSGAYTSLGNYPDADLGAIVDTVADRLSMSVADTLRLVGRLGFEHLAARAPELLATHSDWRSVLLSLDEIIHPEVLKIYPDSEVPGSDVSTDGDALLFGYTSSRNMCALADGLIVGCGSWYGTELHVDHVTCVHADDSSCTMRVTESS